MINIYYFIFLFCLKEALCYTIVVHQNFLTEEAKTLAIGLAEDSILHNNTNRDVAKRLSDDFNMLYGTKWLAFVGPQGIDTAVTQMDMISNTLLWFSVDSQHYVIFKTVSNTSNTTIDTQNQLSFNNVLREAAKFNVTFKYTGFNSSMESAAITIIKDAINRFVSINCSTTTIDRNVDASNCYFRLSEEIVSKLESKYGHSWIVIVEPTDKASWSYRITQGVLESKNVWVYLGIVFSHLLDITIWYIPSY